MPYLNGQVDNNRRVFSISNRAYKSNQLRHHHHNQNVKLTGSHSINGTSINDLLQTVADARTTSVSTGQTPYTPGSTSWAGTYQ